MNTKRFQAVVVAVGLMAPLSATGAVGDQAEAAIPELVSVLSGEHGVVLGDTVVPAHPLAVEAALDALAGIGEPAVPRLLAAARDASDDGVRDLLSLALARIGAPALPALTALLREGSVQEQLWSVHTLALFRDEACQAATSLAGRSEDPSPVVRGAAGRELQQLRLACLRARL